MKDKWLEYCSRLFWYELPDPEKVGKIRDILWLQTMRPQATTPFVKKVWEKYADENTRLHIAGDDMTAAYRGGAFAQNSGMYLGHMVGEFLSGGIYREEEFDKKKEAIHLHPSLSNTREQVDLIRKIKGRGVDEKVMIISPAWHMPRALLTTLLVTQTAVNKESLLMAPYSILDERSRGAVLGSEREKYLEYLGKGDLVGIEHGNAHLDMLEELYG